MMENRIFTPTTVINDMSIYVPPTNLNNDPSEKPQQFENPRLENNSVKMLAMSHIHLSY